MVKQTGPTVIKKYANRRLYHTGTSAYVTLDDLADMVRRDEEFVVQDAKTGEDITRGVLGQIIFDAEARGGGLMPIAFLRQLITLYGGQMQALVPAYLEQSLAAFAKEQEKLRKQMNQAIGAQAFDVVQDQVRANMDMFQRSMRLFMPFQQDSAPQEPAQNGAAHHARGSSGDAQNPLASDVAALRSELQKMQERLDAMTPSNAGVQALPVQDVAAEPEPQEAKAAETVSK